MVGYKTRELGEKRGGGRERRRVDTILKQTHMSVQGEPFKREKAVGRDASEDFDTQEFRMNNSESIENTNK